MWPSVKVVRETIQSFVEALFQEEHTSAGQIYTASVAVSEDTTSAIYEATKLLLESLTDKQELDPNDIICAAFITNLTADYPARTARELFGWHTVPLLCAQETGMTAQSPGSITGIIAVNTQQPMQEHLTQLHGMRGALLLEDTTSQTMQRELRWLFTAMLTCNQLPVEAIKRAIVTITPDLSIDDARAAASAALDPAIPALVAQEMDVPGAPARCLRVLLIAQAASQPQPVYSEPARRRLRPDLPRYVPQTIRVSPSGPLRGELAVPSSKYHTLRAILAAFLAEGTSIIEEPAESDDTTVLLKACKQLGAIIDTSYHAGGCTLHIQGVGGRIRPPAPLTIDVGNAGAVLRLLLGVCALSPQEITFTTSYPESLGRRPNDDLLQALDQLGVEIKNLGPQGTLPITLQGGHPHGGLVRLSGKKSSQFLSALLYLAPLLEEDVEIEIIDTLASASFIDLTIQMLHQAGITIMTQERYRRYAIPGGQSYKSQSYRVPGDYPSAAALLAAVAVAKGEITLYPLPPDDTDGTALLSAFARLGLRITRGRGRLNDHITVRAEGPLQHISLDGSRVIDSVPYLAAAACFASRPSVIHHIANLRLKESDRIYDLAAELSKVGCHVIPSKDMLEIAPAKEVAGGVEVDAHADHRLAQALAVAGLGSQQPITIHNAHHVAKSYPAFFDDLASLGASITAG
ncbi:MAG TPA: 3-phosphoshikimate 1-carboxyvinyltransferase [Ktedonobacterales bacterium]|nr:3-phosphoshikimate 1-carboxyvinyltransferase [Ktedonobacterales bacterium]